MAEIDWDTVLPRLYPDLGLSPARRQRDADLERVKPLVEALLQILDWTTLDGSTYYETWGHTPRCDLMPRELAYLTLRDLGVLPEVPERTI